MNKTRKKSRAGWIENWKDALYILQEKADWNLSKRKFKPNDIKVRITIEEIK